VVVDIVKVAGLTALARLPGLIQRIKSFFRTGLDPNDWRALCAGLEGSRMTPLSTLKGKRVGTRELLLKVQEERPDRLTIRTGALATRVVWDGTRASGIEYLEGRHLYRADPQFNASAAKVLRTVRATREVILAGGTFNTPQLLQLSGIGPGDLLRKHGIEVRVDLPGVGANLQDRYEVSVVNEMKEPFKLLEGATMLPPVPPEQPDRYLRRWIDEGGGIYTTNGAVISIMKKSTPRRPCPDLLLFGLITKFYGYFPGYSQVVSSARKYFTWTILKGYSHNTAGRVAIRSKDPQDMPDINFNSFDERSETSNGDLEAVVDAIELARRMTDPYRRGLVEREVVPGDAFETREQLRQFVRNEAWGHHASGTCKIGTPTDRLAVVDSRFRVHGTKGLRVVDASVFPRIPGLFIVSAVYTVAEKASDLILADAKSDGGARA
jgi:choline dehydrogenase